MLGDKWSLLILRDIIIHKKSRFKELKDSKEKIATNILANRLKSLSELGLIEKLDPTGTKKKYAVSSNYQRCYCTAYYNRYVLIFYKLDR